MLKTRVLLLGIFILSLPLTAQHRISVGSSVKISKSEESTLAVLQTEAGYEYQWNNWLFGSRIFLGSQLGTTFGAGLTAQYCIEADQYAPAFGIYTDIGFANRMIYWNESSEGFHHSNMGFSFGLFLSPLRFQFENFMFSTLDIRVGTGLPALFKTLDLEVSLLRISQTLETTPPKTNIEKPEQSGADPNLKIKAALALTAGFEKKYYFIENWFIPAIPEISLKAFDLWESRFRIACESGMILYNLYNDGSYQLAPTLMIETALAPEYGKWRPSAGIGYSLMEADSGGFRHGLYLSAVPLCFEFSSEDSGFGFYLSAMEIRFGSLIPDLNTPEYDSWDDNMIVQIDLFKGGISYEF